MTSPYVVLGDRPLDQWKVTELKEELKKRGLTIGGLKVDLLKRLDEAVRHEQEENEKESVDNGLSSGIQSELPFEQETTEAVVSGSAGDHNDCGTREVDSGPANEFDDGRLLDKGKIVERDIVKETSTAGLEQEQEQSAQYAGSETTVLLSETVESVTTVTETFLLSDRTNEMADSTVGLENDALKPQEDAGLEPSNANNEFPQINQNSMSVLSPTGPSLLDDETQNDAANSTVQLQNNESNSLLSNQSFLPPNNQVSKVDHSDFESLVVPDSVSSESMSLIEKNELKVDVITDNVKLELDVKHEMVQPSLNSVAPDGGESHPMDVEPLDNKDVKEPLKIKVSVGESGGSNSGNDYSLKNTGVGDLDPHEKLSLDRSPRDDFMEDDILDSKQKEYEFNDSETIDYVEKSEIFVQKENIVDVVGNDKPLVTEVVETEQKTVPALSSSKRKFDKEAVVNNDIAKRARRWNTEVGTKSSEPQSGATVASAVLDDSAQPTFKCFSRSNSLVNEEPSKERLVPPSSKPPTNSLRIDRFLRPFTLKAVQELLGKTGTVNSFWMDQIKTHCYVSYSSVEEAVDTRNAVYNLQWPPNGGRLLVAEFVDPEEVKKHVEVPPASEGALATPPSNATPAFSAQQHGTAPPQPSPRGQVSKQQLPPPPPPTSKPRSPHTLREPTATSAKDQINLPPPPPLVTKVEPPIVTLDDLFRKTKAIPRIYYLPLSDEQVAAKKLNKGNVNQCRKFPVKGGGAGVGGGSIKDLPHLEK